MRLLISLYALVGFSMPALAQLAVPAKPQASVDDIRLNELRSAPAPKHAKDLDTLQLASAQRERVASVEEKTNGLWQSWLVSVCEGCGDTPSYRKTVGDDFANRKARFLSSLKSNAVRARVDASRAQSPTKSGRSLYADLSSENISRIRRMPGQ